MVHWHCHSAAQRQRGGGCVTFSQGWRVQPRRPAMTLFETESLRSRIETWSGGIVKSFSSISKWLCPKQQMALKTIEQIKT